MSKEENTLEKIYTGEKMAIEIMETYIENIKDENIKTFMRKWITDHEENATLIANYLLEQDKKPNEKTGLPGIMARSMAKFNTIFNAEPLDILHEVYDGEDKGIERSVQISKNELSSEATQLVEKVLHIDHNHLKEMKQLISKYENTENL